MQATAFKIQTFVAADGMAIGYRTIGIGRGLILVHGGLQSSLNFTDLAHFLSTRFTVYILERRGRGISPFVNEADNLNTLANDVLSLAGITKSKYIFGLSSGAIISLKAVVSKPVFEKIALYEPPLSVDGNPFISLETKYENAISKGNLGRALIEILKGLKDRKDRSLLVLLPAFITAPLINIMMEKQTKTATELPLKCLVPTFQYDLNIVKQSKLLPIQAKNIQAEVLLLGGTKSQTYLKEALNQLHQAILSSKRIELKNQGHLAADNSEAPQIVANELIHFFE